MIFLSLIDYFAKLQSQTNVFSGVKPYMPDIHVSPEAASVMSALWLPICSGTYTHPATEVEVPIESGRWESPFVKPSTIPHPNKYV